ncbi:MAG: N-acetylmuramoyl-L-alanine amidase [Negativicutes bacterium]|nr:N-acetylmuramoyl-L-alanine amidase [Negativicutes bacterium]
MYSKKHVSLILLCLFTFVSIIAPLNVSYAAPIDDIVKTIGASTINGADALGGGNIFEKLFSFIFEKLLGPLFNIVGGKSSSSTSGSGAVKVTPLPPQGGTVQDSGALRGKTIVVDPGHGGSNPGAVANSIREADNNLAVAQKVRDKLVQAGAKVVMTRTSDRTVAPEGSSLGHELQARLDIAAANNADIFVSIHSNSNPDPSIAGAMTFFPSGKSQKLALDVQTSLIKETGAQDKGVAPATFYVLRNATMPSILVEMGFVSNAAEAARLASDSYRNQIAQGIFSGIVRYFNTL